MQSGAPFHCVRTKILGLKTKNFICYYLVRVLVLVSVRETLKVSTQKCRNLVMSVYWTKPGLFPTGIHRSYVVRAQPYLHLSVQITVQLA